MRNIGTYTLTVLLTVLVFYGGAGVNVVFYCCNQCRSAGIEMLLNDQCHASHKPAADEHPLFFCSAKAERADSDCCGTHAPLSCCAEADRTDSDGCGTRSVKTDNHCTHASDDNCCNMQRISFDWNTHHTTESGMNLSPVVFDLLLSELPDSSVRNFMRGRNGAVMPKGPPFVCPRDYLSRLTILLI
jgi:hypothetical protein